MFKFSCLLYHPHLFSTHTHFKYIKKKKFLYINNIHWRKRDERKICDKFNLAHQKTLNNNFYFFFIHRNILSSSKLWIASEMTSNNKTVTNSLSFNHNLFVIWFLSNFSRAFVATLLYVQFNVKSSLYQRVIDNRQIE